MSRVYKNHEYAHYHKNIIILITIALFLKTHLNYSNCFKNLNYMQSKTALIHFQKKE